MTKTNLQKPIPQKTHSFCLKRFGQIDHPAPKNPSNDNGLEPEGLVGGSGGSRGIGL